MNDRAEVNGPVAPDAVRHTVIEGEFAVVDLSQPAAPENSSPNPFAVRGFQKGYDPRRNTAGRIKKAPTVLDETQKLAERAKHRRRVAAAWVETMEKPHTAAGQRAREAYRDTFHGIPKQTLVLEQGESPLLAFLQRRQEREALPPAGDTTYSDTADDIT